MIKYLSKKNSKVKYFDPSGEKNEYKGLKNVNYCSTISSACLKSDLIISIRESSNSGFMRTKSFIFLYLLLPKIKSKIFFPINPEEPNINAVFISY